MLCNAGIVQEEAFPMAAFVFDPTHTSMTWGVHQEYHPSVCERPKNASPWSVRGGGSLVKSARLTGQFPRRHCE
jgi:hypothetical protein